MSTHKICFVREIWKIGPYGILLFLHCAFILSHVQCIFVKFRSYFFSANYIIRQI